MSAFATGNDSARDATVREMQRLRPNSVWEATSYVATVTDSLAGARRIALVLTDSTRHSDTTRAHGHLALALVEIARGRPRSASTHFALARSRDSELALVYHAWSDAFHYFATPEAELRARRDELQRAVRPIRDRAGLVGLRVLPGDYPHVRTYLLGLIDARLGDVNGAVQQAVTLEQQQADSLGLRQDLALELRALALATAGDTAAAVAALERLNLRSGGWGTPIRLRPFGRFLRAELLYRSGKHREALAWYSGIASLSLFEFVHLAPTYLRMAEIYERLGDPRQAAEYYSRFVARWQECDQDLRPLVDEARRRLAVLRTRPVG